MEDEMMPSQSPLPVNVTRRRVCQLGLATFFMGMAPRISQAGTKRSDEPERFLDIYNTHTDERLKVVYWANGTYISKAFVQVNQILRDHRTNEVTTIAPELIDFLYLIGKAVEARYPFHIVSGYRSPATNAMLRGQSKQVAKYSRHIKGQAVDFYLPRRDLAVVRRAAVAAKRGGVGYYPQSNFIHVDTGRVRTWERSS